MNQTQKPTDFLHHSNESLLLSCHNFSGFIICCPNPNSNSYLGASHCKLHSSDSKTKWPKFPTFSGPQNPQVSESWNGNEDGNKPVTYWKDVSILSCKVTTKSCAPSRSFHTSRCPAMLLHSLRISSMLLYFSMISFLLCSTEAAIA